MKIVVIKSCYLVKMSHQTVKFAANSYQLTKKLTNMTISVIKGHQEDTKL